MPTIKDIAIKAGVSHGTVSNVLNKRGNVSSEKIQLVEKVAREMGYKINVQAQQLRAGMNRKVCVILPQISSKSYNDMYTGLELYLRSHDFDVELSCSGHLEYAETEAVKKALSANPMAIVVVSSLMKNRGLFEGDTQFVFAERKLKDMPERGFFASFAFDKAGKEMALQCVRDGHKSVAVFCEHRDYSNDREFLTGVSDVFEDYNISCEVYHSDDHMRLNKAFDILNSEEEYDAVIAVSQEDVEHLKMAHRYNPEKKLPAIYALTSKKIGYDHTVKRYELNYKMLGRKIGEQIVESCDQNGAEERASGELIVEADGFYNDSVPCGKKTGEHISFLMIQNLTSKAIRMLLPQFTRETGIQVNMVEVSYDEHYKISRTCSQYSPYDLIRIDMAWMAEFGDKIYHPLSETDEDILWLKERMVPTLSNNYSYINGTRYAFPLDACIQMLFYRKDLFEDELIKREFFEACKRKLEVPGTFAEYNEIARFFTRKVNPGSRVQYGASVTYGRTFLAACDFLPRFREYQKSIFDSKGFVQINTDEMKAAVQNYMETCRCAGNDTNPWWRETTKQFSEGRTAMHIVFSNYAADMIHNTDSKIVGRIGFGKVPGGQPLSGGGTIGISRFSKKYDACITFLKWLYQKETAETLTYLGGYICNRDVSKNMDIIELYPWLEGMEQCFESGWRIYESHGNHLFNEFQFEDILGKAIRLIASGIEGVNTALDEAQAECDTAFNQWE